jgi:hypothetical protein
MRPHRWTTNRITLGTIGGLFLALCMDVGAAKTSLGFCLGLGAGAMIGVVIAVYSDLDIFRPGSWYETPPHPQRDALWDREHDA